MTGIDAQEIYNALDHAGLLVSASWTPVSLPTETRKVYFRESDQDVLGGVGAMTREYLIEYPSDFFPNLKRGETMVIGGANYKVIEASRPNDSLFTVAKLSKL